MRIKTTTLLKAEDVPADQRTWVTKLILPINEFFSQAIQIINDGGVFPDNFVGRDYVFSFTYQSETVSFPQKFAWDRKVKPLALQVVSATEDGAPIAIATAWQFTVDGKVSLTSVVKLTNAPAVVLLTADSKYLIRVRVTP